MTAANSPAAPAARWPARPAGATIVAMTVGSMGTANRPAARTAGRSSRLPRNITS